MAVEVPLLSDCLLRGLYLGARGTSASLSLLDRRRTCQIVGGVKDAAAKRAQPEADLDTVRAKEAAAKRAQRAADPGMREREAAASLRQRSPELNVIYEWAKFTGIDGLPDYLRSFAHSSSFTSWIWRDFFFLVCALVSLSFWTVGKPRP